MHFRILRIFFVFFQKSLANPEGACYNVEVAMFCRGIEVVITGLTRNQFVRKHTRVRIPPSAPKQKRSANRCSVFVLVKNINRDSNAVRKQHGVLFLNGDRRILQSITLNPNRNALQNSRTNPSLCAKEPKRNRFGSFYIMKTRPSSQTESAFALSTATSSGKCRCRR